MKIPWYVTAIGAALVWGVHYPLVDHALKKLSLVSVLLLTALPIVVLALFFHRTLAADYAVWTTLDTGPRIRVLALALTSLLGSVLLFLSIAGKNATLASLIEISYPVFVAGVRLAAVPRDSRQRERDRRQPAGVRRRGHDHLE